jgi:hypothetical protein
MFSVYKKMANGVSRKKASPPSMVNERERISLLEEL